MDKLLFALWFFLPAGLSNLSPVLASQLKVFKVISLPLDFGIKIRKKRIFGRNKTWGGLICGVVVASLTVLTQIILYINNEWIRHISHPVNYSMPHILWLGPLLGAGALIGDAVESFFKRQLGIKPGASWFPFDQIDYIIGAELFSLVLLRLPAINYLVIALVWFLMHLVFTYLGYLVGVRSKPI